MFRKVADFAALAVSVAVAVRVNDDAASVRWFAFLPLFTCDFFAFVFNARFLRIVVFIKIAFGALTFFVFVFEDAASEIAFKVARINGFFFNAVSVLVFFESVDAFALFFAVSVDVAV